MAPDTYPGGFGPTLSSSAAATGAQWHRDGRIGSMRRVPAVFAIVISIPFLVAAACNPSGTTISLGVGTPTPTTTTNQEQDASAEASEDTAPQEPSAPTLIPTPTPTPTPSPSASPATVPAEADASIEELLDLVLGIPPAPTLTPMLGEPDPGVQIAYADATRYRLELRWRLADSDQPW